MKLYEVDNHSLRFFSTKIENDPFATKTKPGYSNFNAKEMDSLWSMLQDCQIINKKLIRTHTWWFETSITFLGVKNSLMVKMHTRLINVMKIQLKS